MDAFSLVKIQLSQLALTTADIAFATSIDPKLKKLYNDILISSNKRDKHWIYDGCIFFDTRVWVPIILQHNILEFLHIEHVGAIKMKKLALSYHVYWPKINEDIEKLAKNCFQCTEILYAPKKVFVRSWEVPKEPWEKIHINFAGPFMKKLFLLVVDEYSMWPEVFILNSLSASNTIEKLKLLFSRFDQPRVLVSDNVTSFMAEKFQTFLKSFGIEHCACVPYNAASYNKVKRFVINLKRALIEFKDQVGSVQDKLNTLLFTCRHSRTTSNKKSPAQLFLGRELRSNLGLLKSTSISDKITKKTLKKKDATSSKLFHYGQKITIFSEKIGFIINADGSNYLTVMIDGKVKRCHKDQVIPFPVIKPVSDIQTVPDTQPVLPRRPKRIIKPIERLNYI